MLQPTLLTRLTMVILQALPICLDKIVDPAIAIVLSVTAVLLFGKLLRTRAGFTCEHASSATRLQLLVVAK